MRARAILVLLQSELYYPFGITLLIKFKLKQYFAHAKQVGTPEKWLVSIVRSLPDDLLDAIRCAGFAVLVLTAQRMIQLVAAEVRHN